MSGAITRESSARASRRPPRKVARVGLVAVALLALSFPIGVSGASADSGVAGAGAAGGAVIEPIVGCDSLGDIDLSGVLETTGATSSAGIVGEGEGAYCRVTAEVGGATRIEARLPVSTWTGRYLQLGCGGMCGSISFRVTPSADTALALDSNAFVVAATNEGHDDPTMLAGGIKNELRADYGHRANHWTAVAAKHLAEVYYGQQPAFSYFHGYSDGGRAAANEAQRYPDDFDGIIVGAPAIYTNEGLTAFFIWRGIHAAALDTDARALLADAAMATCDGADGTIDGQISDPRACDFDPAELACAEGVDDSCLDATEVAAAHALYTGPVTENGGGKFMYPGGLPEGSELNWPSGPGAVPTIYGQNLAYAKGPAADWTWEDFEFTVQSWQELQRMAKVYNADNGKDPDLSEFDASGGKLMVWYGLADASTGQDSTLDWYAQIQERAGGLDATQDFARLFQVPGLYHGGGYIDYRVEMLQHLIAWVEDGTEPEQIIASATTPVERTYPVYAYPARAAYTGEGSVYDAANWESQTPAEDPDDHFPWLGNRYAKHD